MQIRSDIKTISAAAICSNLFSVAIRLHGSLANSFAFLSASDSLSFSPFWFTRTMSQCSVRMTVPRGSASTSSYEFAENIGEILGEVSIFTATGESVALKDLWDQNQGVAVVALLRHFGCACCWEFASALKESMARFESAGVKLIAIGVGTPDKALMLAEQLPFPKECLYCDPERKVYDLLDLYYGFGRTFFSRATVKAFLRLGSLRKVLKNYTIKATPDDKSGILQQGGMFVFRGKQLLYAWKDEGPGDHAPLDDVFDALQSSSCLSSNTDEKPV